MQVFNPIYQRFKEHLSHMLRHSIVRFNTIKKLSPAAIFDKNELSSSLQPKIELLFQMSP